MQKKTTWIWQKKKPQSARNQKVVLKTRARKLSYLLTFGQCHQWHFGLFKSGRFQSSFCCATKSSDCTIHSRRQFWVEVRQACRLNIMSKLDSSLKFQQSYIIIITRDNRVIGMEINLLYFPYYFMSALMNNICLSEEDINFRGSYACKTMGSGHYPLVINQSSTAKWNIGAIETSSNSCMPRPFSRLDIFAANNTRTSSCWMTTGSSSNWTK